MSTDDDPGLLLDQNEVLLPLTALEGSRKLKRPTATEIHFCLSVK